MPDYKFTSYAAKPTDESFLHHDDDFLDDEGRWLVVWCRVQRDFYGRLTSKPDLSFFHREEQIPFGTHDPLAWVDRNAPGRTRISRDLRGEQNEANNFSKPDHAPISGPTSDTARPSRSRRKKGHKHFAKRSRDYARRMAQFQPDEDVFTHSSPRTGRNTANTGNNGNNDPSDGSSSSSDSEALLGFAAQIDSKRR